MATVESLCEECEGKRFLPSVLEYKLGGRDISEVLANKPDEATLFGAPSGLDDTMEMDLVKDFE